MKPVVVQFPEEIIEIEEEIETWNRESALKDLSLS